MVPWNALRGQLMEDTADQVPLPDALDFDEGLDDSVGLPPDAPDEP